MSRVIRLLAAVLIPVCFSFARSIGGNRTIQLGTRLDF